MSLIKLYFLQENMVPQLLSVVPQLSAKSPKKNQCFSVIVKILADV